MALTPSQRDAARQRNNREAGMRRVLCWISPEAGAALDIIASRHKTIKAALEAAILAEAAKDEEAIARVPPPAEAESGAMC